MYSQSKAWEQQAQSAQLGRRMAVLISLQL